VRPLICAHRGSSGVSGLSASERYRRAIDLGVDFIEFDVRRTGDGAYVIYHEPKTPSGRALSQISRAEFTSELGRKALGLDELLEIANGRVGLHVDLKEIGYEAEIVRRLRADCDESKFVVTSLEDVSIRTIKDAFPTVQVGLSLGRDLAQASPWQRVSVRASELFPDRRLKACGADFVAVHKRLATLRVLDYCAARKMPAWVWTLEDELEIARFWSDPRVAAVITDRPDRALSRV
jgi:glycerophosphoryl diester phosphodiesterase